MKEKNQKILMIAGLVLAGALLVFGISKVLYREPAVKLPESNLEEESEVKVEEPDVEETVDMPDEEAEESNEELVIETEQATVTDVNEQKLQETPQKTEKEKPEEPPKVTEESDFSNPDIKPEYEEKQKEEEKPAPSEPTSPHGQEQGGKIYIDGFGWVTNHGGGGSGTTASDMYENGNKVGIME